MAEPTSAMSHFPRLAPLANQPLHWIPATMMETGLHQLCRRNLQQQLLVSLREDELRRSMTAARTDIERRAIRKSLDALRDARRPDGSENPQNDADVWHQLDRKWCAGNADERMKLKTDFEELTKSKPIWPRAADATKRNNEQSHLLTTIPTNFEFDEKIFRRVELALSRDELSLAAARESATSTSSRPCGRIRRGASASSGLTRSSPSLPPRRAICGS